MREAGAGPADKLHQLEPVAAGPLQQRIADLRRSIGAVNSAVRVVHFAGCSDAKFSYGSAVGGQWTNARLAVFRPGMTYREWFDAAARRMPGNQVPILTLDPAIGSFANEPALR